MHLRTINTRVELNTLYFQSIANTPDKRLENYHKYHTDARGIFILELFELESSAKTLQKKKTVRILTERLTKTFSE